MVLNEQQASNREMDNHRVFRGSGFIYLTKKGIPINEYWRGISCI